MSLGFALSAITCNLPRHINPPVVQNPGGSFWWTPTPASIFNFPGEASGPQITLPPSNPQPEEVIPPPPAKTPLPNPDGSAPILYYAQSGDTLPAIAIRFAVSAQEITSPDPIPETELLKPKQLLLIPRRLSNTTSSQHLLPDSEVIYSPSAIDFDVKRFVQESGGYLNTYAEYLGSTGNTSGADIVERVALENSINPRLLLALLDYQSNWVSGRPSNLAQTDYPMGRINLSQKDLYRQLVWAVNQLSIGYYGWREHLLTDLVFPDRTTARLAPDLNAGTVALQYYLAQVYNEAQWLAAIDTENGIPGIYQRMFGNPWVRAINVEPLFPPDLVQPPLILPFLAGQVWSYSGGPHGAWEHDGARAALDFAPASVEPGCVESLQPVVASAPGLVVRTGNGVVVLDLDGDGHEQTGWALLYLHVSYNGNKSLAPKGTWVEPGDPLGYPSCEGGRATGTHIHYARKYNGEWIAADGPLPFVLSGWRAHAGFRPYDGTLTRGDETIVANPLGTYDTRIVRQKNEP